MGTKMTPDLSFFMPPKYYYFVFNIFISCHKHACLESGLIICYGNVGGGGRRHDYSIYMYPGLGENFFSLKITTQDLPDSEN